ncbi:hypothetical protein GS966_28635 [Rhodococcus hoagii]|nr:hypothetical protein [Prescottella equi]
MTTPSRSGPIDRDTRLELKELLLTPQYYWMGSQTEIAFLAEVYDSKTSPATTTASRRRIATSTSIRGDGLIYTVWESDGPIQPDPYLESYDWAKDLSGSGS